jgi:hypothetical protein
MFLADTKLIPLLYHKNCIRYSIFTKRLKLFKMLNSKGHLKAQQQQAFK